MCLPLLAVVPSFLCTKINGKVHPIAGLAGTEGEYRYIFTLSLTLGLDGMIG